MPNIADMSQDIAERLKELEAERQDRLQRPMDYEPEDSPVRGMTREIEWLPLKVINQSTQWPASIYTEEFWERLRAGGWEGKA